VKTVNAQLPIAKWAWVRPSATSGREPFGPCNGVGSVMGSVVAIDWVTGRSSEVDGSMYSQATVSAAGGDWPSLPTASRRERCFCDRED